MIQVKTFYAYNELRNFSYLLYDDKSGAAWVIDPFEARPFIDYIKRNSLSLQGILNTHGHFDHTRGNGALMESFQCGVEHLVNSETITLNENSTIEGIDTPGHTMDHQVFLLHQEASPTCLFSGDTLFNAGVGNCKNGGDVSKLYETTKKLIEGLDEGTLLYPGHDYIVNNLKFAQSIENENSEIKENLRYFQDEKIEDRAPLTLRQEKKINPFLRLSSEELRQKLNISSNKLEDKEEVERRLFYQLRSMRDKW